MRNFLCIDVGLTFCRLTITGLESAGMRHLCGALLTNRSLRELWVPANGITATGVWYLMQMLRFNRDLTTIRIDRNKAPRECLEAFAKTVMMHRVTMCRVTTGDHDIDRRLAAHYNLPFAERQRVLIEMHLALEDKNFPRWLDPDQIYPVVPRNFIDDASWADFALAPVDDERPALPANA